MKKIFEKNLKKDERLLKVGSMAVLITLS